jgi:hypothetical protein
MAQDAEIKNSALMRFFLAALWSPTGFAGGEYVIPGNIIIRQRGTKFRVGENVGLGRDHTVSLLSLLNSCVLPLSYTA